MRFTGLLTTVLLAVGVSAEGINCKGSSNCGNIGFKLTDMRDTAEGLDDNRTYYNGEHIVCWENYAKTGFCAFLQGSGGMLGSDIKRLLQELVNHGCSRCGSVPVFFPGDNDIRDHGFLTVNYVSKPNCID
ncbi:hypothetical protein ACLX1H_008001 [Fusarium chlamydosporum]